MPKQLTHSTTPLVNKTFPIVLICDGVQSPSNIGSLFRICDALGISEIIFCNATINFNSARLKKTARSTYKKVSYLESPNIINTINNLKSDDYLIVALEITTTSIDLERLSIQSNKKIALIIGNEQYGISKKTLENADKTINIKMFGNNSSINVVQAASIALYTIVNKVYLY